MNGESIIIWMECRRRVKEAADPIRKDGFGLKRIRFNYIDHKTDKRYRR